LLLDLAQDLTGKAMQLLTLLLVAAPASVAGLYQAQQMEVGAALELQKGGHFRYQLDYGAVSEQAEGDWSFDGKTVRLTTMPMPRQPNHELVRDDPAPKGELTMTVEPPGFGADYRVDAVAVDAATGEKGLVTTESNGRVDTGGRAPVSRSADPRLRNHWRPFRACAGAWSPPRASLPCERPWRGGVQWRAASSHLSRTRFLAL
jgi:hypothetical protein